MAAVKGATLPASVSVSVRPIKDQATALVIADVIKSVNSALDTKIDQNLPATPLLVSPSGYIFAISVSDTGTLTTTLIRQPT